MNNKNDNQICNEIRFFSLIMFFLAFSLFSQSKALSFVFFTLFIVCMMR